MKKLFWRYWLTGFFVLVTAGLIIWTWFGYRDFQAVLQRLLK